MGNWLASDSDSPKELVIPAAKLLFGAALEGFLDVLPTTSPPLLLRRFSS